MWLGFLQDPRLRITIGCSRRRQKVRGSFSAVAAFWQKTFAEVWNVSSWYKVIDPTVEQSANSFSSLMSAFPAWAAGLPRLYSLLPTGVERRFLYATLLKDFCACLYLCLWRSWVPRYSRRFMPNLIACFQWVRNPKIEVELVEGDKPPTAFGKTILEKFWKYFLFFILVAIKWRKHSRSYSELG